MAIHYVVHSKKNPLKPDDEALFYLVARSLPAVDRDTFVEDMVRHTSLTKNEAGMAIEFMFESLPRYIALGHSVKLGELGFFKPMLQSEGSANPNDAQPNKVIRQRVVFVFGRKFRDLINSLPLQQYPDI